VSGGSNSWDIDLKETVDGVANVAIKEFRFASLTNGYFNASSGRPDNTNESATAFIRWQNANTDPATNTLTIRPDWNLSGWASHEITTTNGEYVVATMKAEGPNESDVWLYNELASVQASSGGGSAPTSTLAEGMVAWWNFNDATDTVATNGTSDGATYNLTTGNTALTTPGVDGVNGDAWTKLGTILTKDHANLRPSSGNAITYAGWAKIELTEFTLIQVGTGDGSRQFYLGRSGGYITVTYSTDGTATTAHATTWVADDIDGTWAYFVLIIDQTGATDYVRVSVNGETLQSFTLSGEVYASAAPFTFGLMTADLDDWVVYDRAWSQSEIEEAEAATDWSALVP
jgi:hypothetical protein